MNSLRLLLAFSLVPALLCGCANEELLDDLTGQSGNAEGYVYLPQPVGLRQRALVQSRNGQQVTLEPFDVLISAYDEVPQLYQVAAGAQVTVIPSDGQPRTTTADAAGHYSFPNLPPGPATLEVVAGTRREAVEVTIPASGTLVGLGRSPVAEFFPVAVGYYWIWAPVPGSGYEGPREPLRLVGTDTFAGHSGIIMQFDVEDVSGWLPTDQFLVRREGNDVFGFAWRGPPFDPDTWLPLVPEETFVKIPLVVGDVWENPWGLSIVLGRMDIATPINGGTLFPSAYVVEELEWDDWGNLVSIEWWRYAQRFGFVGLSSVDLEGEVVMHVVESNVPLPG